ncbi:MAG: CHAT domain-containing tetratricopeptide repeat protein [Acidobacteriota bacterium]
MKALDGWPSTALTLHTYSRLILVCLFSSICAGLIFANQPTQLLSTESKPAPSILIRSSRYYRGQVGLLEHPSDAAIRTKEPSGSARKPSVAVGQARVKEQVHTDVLPLGLGQSVQRELGQNQAHSYSVVLAAGQYLHVVVVQRGIDLVVTLSGPDGKQLTEVDSLNRTQGSESISMIAETTGDHRLNVRSLEKTAAGRYEVKIEELRTATAKDENRVAAETASRQGAVLRRQGTVESLKGALEKFRESLLLSRGLEDRRVEGTVLNNIGELYDGWGEKRKALDYFAQSLSLHRALGDRHREGGAAVRISELYKDLGEMQKARDYLEMALQLTRAASDPGGEAAVLTAFGNRYTSLGESKKALDYYSRALTLWRAVGDGGGEARTLGGMAKASIFGRQPRRALGYYEQALWLQRALGDRRGEAHTLHGISWTYYTLGSKQKALDYNRQALSLMQAVGDRGGEAAIFTNIGWISELSGEAQQALDYYKQALPIMEATGDWDGEANTLFRLANVERDRDQLSKARAYIESALAVTESLRTKVANRESRASYAATVQRYHEFYIDLLFRLHQRSPSAGYDATALQASEAARARGLLELLTEADVDIRQRVDPTLLAQERDLRGLITARTDRRIRILNSRHTEQQVVEATKELEELVSAYQEVEAKIRVANPRYAALTQPRTLTVPQIQQLLDDDTVLLEYALGDIRSYLWAVTSNAMQSFTLESRSVIEAAAGRVHRLLTARTKMVPQEGGVKREARIAKAEVEYYLAASELSRLVLAPIASQLGKKRLVIVSEGVLQYIPFAALPRPAGNGQGAPANTITRKNGSLIRENYKPLIMEHEIVYLPSASTLASLRRELERRNPPAKTVAVFADPVFEATDIRVVHKSPVTAEPSKQHNTKPVLMSVRAENAGRTLDDEGSLRIIGNHLLRTRLIESEPQHPLGRLSYSRREALTIASLVPEAERRIVLDFDVNYKTVTSAELGEYRFLHFATHAWLDAEQPELSGILLSLVDKEGRPQEKGILRLGDVYSLNLPVELVTLSACETALGKSIKGEGLVGLTRGFMYAGAPRVLASLWKVDDAATADLMKIFYEGMLGPQKLHPAAALRRAQIQMWQQNQASPFYWAGFVLQGEWR